MQGSRLIFGAMVVLAAAACGDTPGNPFESSPTTTISTNANDDASTTLGDTSTTTIDDLIFDLDAIVPAAHPGPATGVDAVLGGAPNLTIAAALTAEAAAVTDLTGVTIGVWPVGETGESLLVIDFADSAELYADESGDASTVLLNALLASPLIDDQAITRVVIRYRGTDEEGPYVFTMTVAVTPLRNTLATGASLAEGEALFAITRGEA